MRLLLTSDSVRALSISRLDTLTALVRECGRFIETADQQPVFTVRRIKQSQSVLTLIANDRDQVMGKLGSPR
jgi:hypothetical protein